MAPQGGVAQSRVSITLSTSFKEVIIIYICSVVQRATLPPKNLPTCSAYQLGFWAYLQGCLMIKVMYYLFPYTWLRCGYILCRDVWGYLESSALINLCIGYLRGGVTHHGTWPPVGFRGIFPLPKTCHIFGAPTYARRGCADTTWMVSILGQWPSFQGLAGGWMGWWRTWCTSQAGGWARCSRSGLAEGALGRCHIFYQKLVCLLGGCVVGFTWVHGEVVCQGPLDDDVYQYGVRHDCSSEYWSDQDLLR